MLAVEYLSALNAYKRMCVSRQIQLVLLITNKNKLFILEEMFYA